MWSILAVFCKHKDTLQKSLLPFDVLSSNCTCHMSDYLDMFWIVLVTRLHFEFEFEFEFNLLYKWCPRFVLNSGLTHKVL